MFRSLLLACLLLIASTASSWADDLVATKPGLVCVSADALARLTLPGGSSRTAQGNPTPADLALKQSGGCTDITIGMRVHVETARHNTSIVTYTAPDGQAVTAYVPNIDFEDAVSPNDTAATSTLPVANAPKEVATSAPQALGNVVIVVSLRSSAMGQPLGSFENQYPGLVCDSDSKTCDFEETATPQALCPKLAPCENLTIFAADSEVVGYQAEFSEKDWTNLLIETTAALGTAQQKTIGPDGPITMTTDYWDWRLSSGEDLNFTAIRGTNIRGEPIDTHAIAIYPANSD
jgi:hypothetical protein